MTNIHDMQPRLGNGQFTFTQYADPGQLDFPAELDMWEQNGTFEYPPLPQNARDVVQFWSSVDIPENVLVATNNLYNQRRYDEANQIAEKYVLAHDRVVEFPNMTPEQYTQHVNAYVAQAMAERDQTYPGYIEPTWMRGIVRATKMDQYADQLDDPAEAQKVRNLMVRLPGDYHLTIEQIVTGYRMRELRDNMVDLKRRDDTDRVVQKKHAAYRPPE